MNIFQNITKIEIKLNNLGAVNKIVITSKFSFKMILL